jgi:hypothetical protein
LRKINGCVGGQDRPEQAGAAIDRRQERVACGPEGVLTLALD